MENDQIKEAEIKPPVVMANSSVGAIVDNFKNNITSIMSYFENFGIITQSTDSDAFKGMTSIIDGAFKKLGIDLSIKDNDAVSESTDNPIDAAVAVSVETLETPEDKLGKQLGEVKAHSPGKVEEVFINMAKELKRHKDKTSTRNFEIFSRGSFLMLNNYFEYLLSDLLSYYYNKYQTSLNDKKFDITLKEINEYDSIKEAVKAFITKEVEAMMVELSFDKLVDHFESKLKIINEKDLINWGLINECRERRHLIVHNSSVVNKKYLVRTKNPFNFKIGEIVHVDEGYFANSCNEFYLAGLLLCYGCWGNWDTDKIDECLQDIMVESFDLLVKKQYDVTRKLSEFAAKRIESRNDEQEDLLVRINFNKLIAVKKIQRHDVLEKELKKIKVGTAAPVFKLAHAILSDKHDEILPLIKQVKALDEVDLIKYNDWPLFDFVRDIPLLGEAIRKELQGQIIAIEAVSVEDLSKLNN